MADTRIGFEGVRLLSGSVKTFNVEIKARKDLYHEKNRKERLQVNLLTNFVQEEVLNSITHGIGLLLSVIGAIVLLATYWENVPTIYTRAATIFCVSMLAVYFNSLCYHMFFKFPLLKRIFHRLDRLSVYFLIAGTYAPYSLIVLHGTVGWTLFSFVWTLAGIGFFLDFAFWNKFDTLKLCLYVAMGWSGLLVIVPVMTHPIPCLSHFVCYFYCSVG